MIASSTAYTANSQGEIPARTLNILIDIPTQQIHRVKSQQGLRKAGVSGEAQNSELYNKLGRKNSNSDVTRFRNWLWSKGAGDREGCQKYCGVEWTPLKPNLSWTK